MRLTKLGEICNVSSAGDKPTDFTETKTAEHTIPVVANGIEDDGIIGYTSEPKISRNAVTISARGNIGTAFYRNYPYYPVIRLISVYPKNDSEIDCQYLYYLLKNSPLKSIGSSVQAQLTIPIASDVDLFIEEDYKNQQLIAAFLGTIDDKISTNNKIIETSEKLMREIYDYWFVQFDFPDENGRPYKSSGGEMIYNETLKREIPKGWKVVNIEDLAQLTWGQCPDGVNILDKGSEVPSLPYCSGAGDMDSGYIVNCQARTDNSRREVESETILLSIAGTIGKMAIANEKISLGRATLGIAPNNKKYYALVWLLLKMYNSRLKTASVGAVQKIINKSNMRELNIAIPDITDIDYEALNSTMEIIKSLSLENNKLASLRDWLLPMLMNGQIKVSD